MQFSEREDYKSVIFVQQGHQTIVCSPNSYANLWRTIHYGKKMHKCIGRPKYLPQANESQLPLILTTCTEKALLTLNNAEMPKWDNTSANNNQG